jgi:hypothetical protein
MHKYKIEGDINFYDELLKDDDASENTNTTVCLLTGLPLTKNHLKLPCSHTFNYEALFNEVYNQKQYNEYNVYALQIYDVKCPYCRNITHNLLPYVPTIKKQKINGVNSPDKYTMLHKQCSYRFMRGKNKGEMCNQNGFETDDGDLCEKHWMKRFAVKTNKSANAKSKANKKTTNEADTNEAASANGAANDAANEADTNEVGTSTHIISN